MPRLLPSLPLAVIMTLAGCTTNDLQFGIHDRVVLRPIVVGQQVFTVASGKRSRLATAFSLNPDCSRAEDVTIRILASPTHGTATVETGRFCPNYPTANIHSACNVRLTDGLAAWYPPSPGYAGVDALELEIIGNTGGAIRKDYHIEVNEIATRSTVAAPYAGRRSGPILRGLSGWHRPRSAARAAGQARRG